jgi:hypothetical protein
VVAASPEDAWEVLREETGLTAEDFDLTEEQMGRFWVEWHMAEHGRGYVGSSDF